MSAPDLLKDIANTVKTHKIVIFMKGVPEAPQCGFSAQSCQVLQQYGQPFHAVDVLTSAALRQGVKDFTQWPTIPQIFINGEFVGGCDILMQSHQNGELKKLIEA